MPWVGCCRPGDARHRDRDIRELPTEDGGSFGFRHGPIEGFHRTDTDRCLRPGSNPVNGSGRRRACLRSSSVQSWRASSLWASSSGRGFSERRRCSGACLGVCRPARRHAAIPRPEMQGTGCPILQSRPADPKPIASLTEPPLQEVQANAKPHENSHPSRPMSNDVMRNRPNVGRKSPTPTSRPAAVRQACSSAGGMYSGVVTSN